MVLLHAFLAVGPSTNMPLPAVMIVVGALCVGTAVYRWIRRGQE